MADKNEVKVLCELADKLSIWREALAGSDKKDPPSWPSPGWLNLTEEERHAAIRSLVLLRDNADLFCRCKSAYRLELDHILRLLRSGRVQLEYSTGDLGTIAVPGFISELQRWAVEIEKGQKDGQGKKVKRKKWTVKLANEAILPIITKYGKTPAKLTVRFLEQESGCPKSTIVKTENWIALNEIKRKYRDGQGKMQHKPVNFSDQMLSIAEQSEDGSVKLHTSHKKKNIESDE